MAAEASHPDFLAPLLRDLAAEGRSAEMPVRGISMRPMLRDGDRVRVVPATASDVRVGDVVILAGSTGPIIHRLVGWWPSRDGWYLLTKGDGSPRLDPPLRANGLVARVVARVRNGHVQRLGGASLRVRGWGRALLSLVMGLFVEAWDRIRGRAAPLDT
jgi:signal peptidase I